nr:transposase [Planomonospora parontospora]
MPYISDGDLSKRVITAAKQTPQRSWLGEVSAVVLQQALADLNTAYRNFFASVSGKRKGPKVAAPRFRSRKDNRQAIRFTKNARFAVTAGGKLRLPKIGDVDVRWSRSLPSEPSSVTVVKDAAGRYFASFVVEAGEEPLPEMAAEVGIDLGLTHFAVLSDGRKIDNPRFLRRAAKKLRKAARHGRTLIRIDRWFPSSKMCGACGTLAESMPLDIRSWTCPCGAVHDRDVNAAKNILAAGRAERLNACGGTVRPAA